ncbi:sugar transferase [Parvibaculum sp.]|uniref:sugar transferase n=1 Tax=Parvibaculum sp. TaxID=2024848 RepID=UPI0032990C5B
MLNAKSEIQKDTFEPASDNLSERSSILTEMFRKALFRNRVQLVGGILFAIGTPLIFRFGFDQLPINSSALSNTIVGSIFALTCGFFFFRRLIDYPGTEGIAYAIPIFAVTYGATVIVFLFLRLDYSRYLLGASYFLTVVWFTCISIGMVRLRTLRIGIVPGGSANALLSLPSVKWREIREVSEPTENLNAVVVDLDHSFPTEWERFITETAVSGTPVFDVKHLRETLTGRLEIEHLSENTLGSLNPDHMYLRGKQAIDRVLALLVIVLLAPFFAIIILAIQLDSPGPAIFRQKRMGYRGSIFTVYKFRTMRAEQVGSVDDRDRAITKAEDDRITRLGHFLRRTRIDELPQVLNILRGEMSWIGPRPEAVPLSMWYEKELPFYRYRHIVHPGISGWAQVMQGHVASTDEVLEKLHYDFYYIKNFSPWLDILIVLKTIRTILTGFGAK